ncbi:manganese efflux pump MntP family protein [Desulfallas thermosapovorans]|uniref:Putative manganese efflux pump MntP n=1 Tax=Desulfallas thermosapovorans DSM 6562 TaxID=1121431 RepID=A0A5S4ZWF4_9FIRM|nr:manganese efflux pump MntP family protein [Desulfallas thermosapovorans]TYO96546.1 putative Mn2+ efflux pump MntP [Desulfallas thermosapovorans DSM 6562]
MELYTLLALAVALGTDAFSMCLGLGTAGITRRQILVVSVTVLVFHVVMPLMGWYAGEFIGTLAGRAASIAGALLLVYLGVKMIRSSIKGGDSLDPKVVLVNTWGLFLLAASVSMDALSVGFSLGTRQVNLLLTAGVIGIVAGVMTFAGLVLGRFVGVRVGRRAVLGGGILLIGIGIHMVLS